MGRRRQAADFGVDVLSRQCAVVVSRRRVGLGVAGVAIALCVSASGALGRGANMRSGASGAPNAGSDVVWIRTTHVGRSVRIERIQCSATGRDAWCRAADYVAEVQLGVSRACRAVVATTLPKTERAWTTTLVSARRNGRAGAVHIHLLDWCGATRELRSALKTVAGFPPFVAIDEAHVSTMKWAFGPVRP